MIIYREGKKILEIKDFKVVGKFMEVATLDCTIKSPTPIEFKIGDYVVYDYNGLTYSLYDIPTPKKQARSGSYGEAFIYELKFKSNMEQLSICPFLDMVANDNGLHYTSLPSFSTFENVYGIATRVQANMDYLYPNKWRIVVADTDDPELLETLNEAKDFSISGQSCLEGLKKVYETWGVGFIHTVSDGLNIITIGKSAGTTSLFRYGKGQGLRTIKKSLQNSDQFCTRVYAYGSTRNIPARWYNEKGYIGEAQYAPYLMIPPSKWADGKPQGAYIDAVFGDEDRVKKYGLRIKTFSYDGSNGRDEIFPSIEKVTAGNIRTAKQELGETKYTPSAAYSDAERMDYILEGSNIEDDGTTVQAGYNLYSDSIKSDITPASGVFVIAEDKGDGTYRQLSLTEEIPICRFNITKLAEYKVGEIDNILTFEKNEFESTVNVEFFMKRPTGDYLKLSQVPYLHQGSAQIVVPLVESEFSAAIEGVYTLVARVTVGWSETYVNPLIPDEPIDLNYTVSGGEALVYRGAKTLKSTFTIKLKQIGFDLNTVKASDGSAKTISFKSGMCSGRSFVITRCEYSASDDSWVLTCRRGVDSSVSQTFPNSIFPISAGDQFILLNINMPDLYVHTAMQRLYDTALVDLKHYSNPQFVVSPEIDNLQMARSPQTLKEGMYMPVEDADINIDDDILIDGVTITEKGNELRRFDVTLRNDKIYNRFSKIATSLSNLESSIEEAKKNTNNTPLTSGEDSIILGGSSPQISIWEHINVGTEENPEWAVIPKSYKGQVVGIVSDTFITAGGKKSDDPNGTATTLGGLNNVDAAADDLQSEAVVLTKGVNATHWTLRALSTLGLNKTELENYLATNSYLKKDTADSLYTSLDSFNALNTKVNDFLEGSDTDAIINKWKELEAFLAGQTESSTLAELLTIKANQSALDAHIANYNNFVNNTYAAHIAAYNTHITDYNNFKDTTNDRLVALESLWAIDEENNALYPRNSRGIWSYDFITAGGKANSGSSSGGLIQAVYDYNNLGGNFNNNNLTDTFNAYAINSIYNEVQELKKSAGGAFNETALWQSLAKVDATKVIDTSHIPNLSGKYLSVNGGTISSTTYYPLYINRTGNNNGVGLLLQLNSTNKVSIGWDSSNGAFLLNNSKTAFLGIKDNGAPYYNNGNYYSLIHSGNYADTTDTRYLKLSGGIVSGPITVEGGFDTKLVFNNTDGEKYNVLSFRESGSEYGNIVVSSGGLSFNGSVILNSTNYNQYALPLSGGTLTSSNIVVLGLDSTHNNQNAFLLLHKGVNKTQLGYRVGAGSYMYDYTTGQHLGIDNNGAPYFGVTTDSSDSGHYILIHTGNISNQIVSRARYLLSPYTYEGSTYISDSTTAETVFTDSLSFSAMMQNTTWSNGWSTVFGFSGYRQYGGSELSVEYNALTPRAALRNYNQSLSGWTSWREFAFLDSNVASATKLQTARTIWGQSFDGTGNIWGGLEMHLPDNQKYVALIYPTSNGLTIDTMESGVAYKNIILNPNGGNVLIGTTKDKGYRFQVEGNLAAFSYSNTYGELGTLPAGASIFGPYSYGLMTWVNGSGNVCMQVGRTDGKATAYNLIMQHLGGNVGIGITNPQYKLDVNGTLNAGETTVSNLISNGDIDASGNTIKARDVRATGVVRGASGEFYSLVPTLNNSSQRYDGSLGSSSAYWANAHLGETYVYGNLVVTGQVAGGQASDRRLKDNIVSMTDTQATNVLKALNPVTFEWNTTANQLGELKGVSDGFIADEYEALIHNSGRAIWANYRAIDYTRVSSYLVKGWQNHETRLEAAERRIKELETELAQYRRA